MAASSQLTRSEPHPAALLSGLEVADLLGIDRRTVRRLAADGELHRVVLGRRSTRYRLADVLAFIDRRTMNDERPAVTPGARTTRGWTPRHGTG